MILFWSYKTNKKVQYVLSLWKINFDAKDICILNLRINYSIYLGNKSFYSYIWRIMYKLKVTTMDKVYNGISKIKQKRILIISLDTFIR